MDKLDNLGSDQVSEKEKSLIAPCGIYCGACDIFLGRTKQLASEMYRILKGFNFADVGPFLMGMEPQQIQDFLEILKRWSQREQCPGCWIGGGNPTCSVRTCAEDNHFLSCAECDKMPCQSIQGIEENQLQDKANWLTLVMKRYSHWNIDNLKRIRDVGYRKFIDEMQDKVNEGFLTSDIISSEMVVTKVLKGGMAEE